MEARKIIFITGGNTGLGLETLRSLLRSHEKYHILLGGRNLEKAQQASRTSTSEIESQSSIEPFQVDVESDESICRAYEEIASKHPRIDCLVNNAGACFDGYVQDGSMTARQAWNKAWDVNVTGAHIMTTTFLPLLLESQDPRLLFITSGLSSLRENSDGDPRYPAPPAGLPKKQLFIGYRSSKAGLNMMMLEWTRALKNDGVKVWSLAPGLLATSLGANTELLKRLGAVEPSIGGDVVRGVIEGKRDADVGNVVRGYKTPIQPW